MLRMKDIFVSSISMQFLVQYGAVINNIFLESLLQMEVGSFISPKIEVGGFKFFYFFCGLSKYRHSKD